MAANKNFDPIAIEEDAVLEFQFSLIDAMNEAGMTKADLAKALGVSRSRVSQMLVSEANPTLKVIARAMALLGRTIDYAAAEAPEKKERRSSGRSDNAGFVSVLRLADSDWAVQQNKTNTANENRYWPSVRKSKVAA